MSVFYTEDMSGSIGKPVGKPIHSPELAEFVGIMMGDGGISSYQATVTLHRIDDLEYSAFVVDTITHLFGYTPYVLDRERESALSIVMSRIELVRFLQEIGLPIGDKIRSGLDIPVWIKARKDLLVHCIRGLIDTDGSVFTHSYMSKGKRYSYKKLSFTSASKPLLQSMVIALREFGMHPRIGRNRDVRLDSIADMKRYFAIIGTHNPKHLRRYLS